MFRNKKKVQTGALVLCAWFLCVTFAACGAKEEDVFLSLGTALEEESMQTENKEEPETVFKEETGVVWVHVCGAVVHPGVVKLSEGSRVMDALELAEGFTKDASQDYINLAEVLVDGQKLYFPTVDEVSAWEVEVEKEQSDLVNINTADVALLCTLPGIGESRAKDIVAYRETQGAFHNPEDIMKVSGIKESVYQKIQDVITVK